MLTLLQGEDLLFERVLRYEAIDEDGAVLTNAVVIKQMPPVNIHAYHFPAGTHTINLPKGIIMVCGFTSDDIKPRDAGLQGAGDEVDWLFLK